MTGQQPSATYRGFRTAGIRLTEEILPELAPHRTEELGDALAGIHAFDKAHLVMLTETGLIPHEHGAELLRTLREMEAEGVEKVRLAAGGGMHSGEQFLIRRLGEAIGGHTNLARSSGDLSEVARRFALREHLLTVVDRLNGFRHTLLRLADEHAETVMPMHTHGQHAQPTGLGHWFAMWAAVFSRDVDRARQLFERLDSSPAGTVIGTGTDFPIDRERTSQLLGFSAPNPNTLDAILSHDVELETSSVVAILATNLGRLGDDLMLWSSQEFRVIDVPDRFCSSSSILAQKKNPDLLEHMKGLAAQTIGAMSAAFVVEKGPSGFPTMERRDTQSALWGSFKLAAKRIEEADALIASMRIDRERLARMAGAHWAQATDLAGALVRECGLSWRTAHQIVGIVVRLSEERDLAPGDVTTALVDEAAECYMAARVGLSADGLTAALDPAEFVRRRDLYGGPAPVALRRELPAFVADLEDDARWVTGVHELLAASALELERAIDRLISPDS